MKAKAIIPLLLALILGLMTFMIGRRVLNTQAVASPDGPGAKVLVAAADLPAGHQLGTSDVKLIETSAETITATMFWKPEDLQGRILTSPAEAGQVVRASMLAPVGTTSSLQAKVPNGMRAVTIAVNEFSGLAGLISPGVKVDLVATLVDNVTGETFARTIVQNVAVSAVGQELDAGQTAKADPRSNPRAHKTVTLLVTPAQAAAIDLAFSKSKPRLVLRSVEDNERVEDDGVTLAELSGRAQEDRLAATAADESSSKLMETLAAMQKQIQDVKQSSDEAARRLAEEAARPASGEQEAQTLNPLHSVRVFRGGSESREEFDAEGRAAGTGKPVPATPARQQQRVEATPSEAPGTAAAE